MRRRYFRFFKRPALCLAAAATVGACCALALTGPSAGSTQTAERAGAAAAGRPPVVLIVFDAFPTVSLLNAHRRIDGVRYPTFARLAADSTWFPYATTSVDETGRAFREIFTSRTSWRFAKPNYAQHPNNLFTLLGRRYHIEDGEEGTSFCPKRLCPNVRPQTKESIEAMLQAGRPERFMAWLERFSTSRRPTFYFKHVLLPHPPWVYLPSGHTYYDGPSERVVSRDDWDSIPWLSQQKYQRFLLHVEFADRLLGRVLDQLRATGLYDRSLIVVTADHGESFGRPGHDGRDVDRRNVGDIALKPLFVKLPFQHAGKVDRRHVRNFDILPTIARVARLRPGWRVEGRSVFGPAARRIPLSTVMAARNGARIRLSPKSLRRLTADSLRLKLKLFGTTRGPFGIGPHRELQGTPAARWPALPASALRAELDTPNWYRGLRLASQSLPVKVTGRLAGPGSGNPVDLAVAVNGTIEATAPAIAVDQSSSRLFTVMIPEASLREGANTVQLFAIEGGADTPALRPLGGT
jgi:hypothetical protein